MTEQLHFEDNERNIKITSSSATFHRKNFEIAKISEVHVRARDANRFLRTHLQIAGGLVAALSMFTFLFQDVITGSIVLLVGILLVLVSLATRKSPAYAVLLTIGKRQVMADSIDSARVAGKVHDAIVKAIKGSLKQQVKPRLTPGRHSIE